NRNRTDGKVDRQLGFKPRAATEVKPQSIRPAEHQIEIHSQAFGWQDFFEKTIAVAWHDNENSLFDLGLDAVVLINRIEIGFSDDAEMFGFESGTGSAPDARDAAAFFRDTSQFDSSRQTVSASLLSQQ